MRNLVLLAASLSLVGAVASETASAGGLGTRRFAKRQHSILCKVTVRHSTAGKSTKRVLAPHALRPVPYGDHPYHGYGEVYRGYNAYTPAGYLDLFMW